MTVKSLEDTPDTDQYNVVPLATLAVVVVNVTVEPSFTEVEDVPKEYVESVSGITLTLKEIFYRKVL